MKLAILNENTWLHYMLTFTEKNPKGDETLRNVLKIKIYIYIYIV